MHANIRASSCTTDNAADMRLQPGYDDHACTFACVHGQCHMRDGNCEGPSSVSLAGIYSCASNMPGVS
eukprot:356181-Chlamydomonas_euryale.AAC.3